MTRRVDLVILRPYFTTDDEVTVGLLPLPLYPSLVNNTSSSLEPSYAQVFTGTHLTLPRPWPRLIDLQRQARGTVTNSCTADSVAPRQALCFTPIL